MSKEVIKRATQGDRSAQKLVLYECSDLVRGFLFRLVGSMADLDDLQQTVYLRLLIGLKHLRQEAALSSWVGSICVNVVRDFWRQRKTRGFVSSEDYMQEKVVDPQNLQQRLEAREALAKCHRVLGKLSVNHRIAFVLRAMGHCVDDIATMMNAGRSTTRLRLYWARKAFARGMTEEVNACVSYGEEVNNND
ncbi:MAG: RNA polymerase sigma factor [Deltaproteobacteria bacterium]|nr:RNA polymerase sigma factor [Deltaproteobacteria bacterium]